MLIPMGRVDSASGETRNIKGIKSRADVSAKRADSRLVHVQVRIHEHHADSHPLYRPPPPRARVSNTAAHKARLDAVTGRGQWPVASGRGNCRGFVVLSCRLPRSQLWPWRWQPPTLCGGPSGVGQGRSEGIGVGDELRCGLQLCGDRGDGRLARRTGVCR